MSAVHHACIQHYLQIQEGITSERDGANIAYVTKFHQAIKSYWLIQGLGGNFSSSWTCNVKYRLNTTTVEPG